MYLQTMEDLRLAFNPGTALFLTRVGHFLAEEGVQSYLVGGLVRDMLLGRDTADIDIAVDAGALEIAPRAATALGGKYVLLDEINGIGRVVLAKNEATPAEGKWELDFSTLKSDIEQDLAQRDFTIDAMAVDLKEIIPEIPTFPPPGEGIEVILKSSALIDPFKGQDDLRQGVIRTVSETAFKSDAVRLLRAVRLAAELGFSIDRETEMLIRHYCHLITGVAGERVREELLRILAVPGTGQLLAYLDELGLLTAMIPELTQAKGVKQPLIHFWDVFDHSIQALAAIDFLLRQGNWEYTSQEVLPPVPWSTTLAQHFEQEVSSGSTRRSLLKLAILLHDIAKPQTKAIDEDGRARFLGHATEGAAIAAGILERLRFSSREIKLVEILIGQHLRPTQMSQHGLPSRRAIYRYFRDTAEAGIDILFLSLADHLATRGPLLDLAQWQEHAQLAEYVLAKHFTEESLAVPLRLIDGHDLINIFGLNPGPGIGEFLEAVREAQAAREVTTRPEALACIKHWLAHPEETPLNKSP
ncbi:CCA tRNA nucleotidyltransferase [Chloroflexota bacterium]